MRRNFRDWARKEDKMASVDGAEVAVTTEKPKPLGMRKNGESRGKAQLLARGEKKREKRKSKD